MAARNTSDGATRPIIGRLVDELRPIKRIWSPEVRFAAWLGLELLLFGVVVSRGLRHDALARLMDPAFAVELGLLVLAGAATSWMALCAAVPGREAPLGLAALGGALVAAASTAVLVRAPFEHPHLAAILVGFPCALVITSLALLPWATLLIAGYRGATVTPSRAGTLAGIGAFSTAAAMVRLRCPSDDCWHLLVWHFGPVLLALVVSAAIGRIWLGAWRAEER